MKVKGVVRGLKAALKTLCKAWSPEQLFCNSDEKFILETLDRGERRKLIAFLSMRRRDRLWSCFIVWVPLLYLMGSLFRSTRFPSTDTFIIFGLVWYSFFRETERLDLRIKLLKLADRFCDSSTTKTEPTAEVSERVS